MGLARGVWADPRPDDAGAVAGETGEGVDIPADHNATATYPIATLSRSSNSEVARAFVAFVLSAEGQEILASCGFDTE